MGKRLVHFIPDGYIEYDNLSNNAKNEIIESVSEVYSTAETLTNKTYLGYPVYRKVINFGALPSAETKAVAHGIKTPFTVCDLYGMAISTGKTRIILPDVTSNDFARLLCTDGNIVIQTKWDYSAYTKSHITIEYIKADL